MRTIPMLYARSKFLTSVRHHYIPQLYLKGFVNSNNKLQVFDKSIGTFLKDQQTPRTVFFGKHRNTINSQDIPTDTIEKLYGRLETPFGEYFKLIRNGITEESFRSKKSIYLLKLYLAIQFWRLPITDVFAEVFIRNLDLARFGNRITFSGTPIGNVPKIKALLETDIGFRHYFRSFLLPLLMFDSQVHEDDPKNWKLLTVSDEDTNWENVLTGDNPIIVEDIGKMFAFKSKLIFPLSKTQVAIYTPSVSEDVSLPPLFSSKLSMVIYAQTQRYLAGTNRDYMNNIIRLYGELHGRSKFGILRGELFEYI